MGRSKWKGPYIDSKLNLKENHVNLISRKCEIIPSFIGHSVSIYNGRTLKEIIINKDMVGYKLGEFNFTRAKFVFKKKKTKKKK